MILEGRLVWFRCAIRRRLSFLYKPFFKKYGKRALIYKPQVLNGSKGIEIGDNSFIFYGARIQLLKTNDKFPSLKIGSGCSIEQNLHLTCKDSISIGNNCMILANTLITDIDHSVEFIEKPYNTQELLTKKVEIGNNVFIGMGSYIMAGVKLGNNVVVGANSVVKGEFPDNVMIVGSPARIIKKYNVETKRWERV